MRTIPASINPMCGLKLHNIPQKTCPKMMSEVYEEKANQARYDNSPYKQFLINPKTLTIPPMQKDWQEITDRMPNDKKMAIIDKFVADKDAPQAVKDAWKEAILSSDMTSEEFYSYIQEMYPVHKD